MNSAETNISSLGNTVSRHTTSINGLITHVNNLIYHKHNYTKPASGTTDLTDYPNQS